MAQSNRGDSLLIFELSLVKRSTLVSVASLLFSIPSVADEAKASVPTEKAIVFCSYNVENWLVMDRFDGRKVTQATSKPDSEKERVIATLLAIQPDALGLIEIGDKDDLLEIQTRLKDGGLDLPHAELAGGIDPTRRLGLLSRFPIVSRDSVADLSYQLDGKTSFIQRGILDVTLDLGAERRLRCLGLHLKSKRPIPDADEALMRRNEAQLVRQHLDSILNKDPKSILLLFGDLNEHRHEPPILAIAGSRTGLNYLEDIPVFDPDGLAWTHFWEKAHVYSRLDYFFVSRALRPWVDLSQSRIHADRDFHLASDHRPIMLTLRPR